ncbi:response regulator, partial [Acinetobacter baumannii]
EMHAPTVLYVNDLNTPREHLEICLNQAGFQFVTASGTDECISIALQRKPAAIIVDMHLPSEDGFNVLFQINTHAQLKSIPTLLIAYTP